MRRLFLAPFLVVSLSLPAFAWSDAGHKIVASIAFSRLTQDERAKVVAILREHPRFEKDFAVPVDLTEENARAEWLFQQSAIWPDIARGFRGADLAEYHRATWHYINLPHFLTAADGAALKDKLAANVSLVPPAKPTQEMNAIQTLRLSRAILVDANADKRQKAVMLAWLFHLVGDIHQPLHSSALFSVGLFPEGDRGGNLVKTRQRSNLHSLWDGFPGVRMELPVAHREALKLLVDRDLATLGESSEMQLDEQQWLDESRDLCINLVYSPEVMAYLRNVEREGTVSRPVDLDEVYLRAGGKVCDRRLVQAGYRLAAVLKRIVASEPTQR